MAPKFMRLQKPARTLVARYRKASLTATSYSAPGTDPDFRFATVTLLMGPPCTLSLAWKRAFETVRLKCGDRIANLKPHCQFLQTLCSRARERQIDYLRGESIQN